jgi:NAD(P)-dependent dehydrogenase (short-subunit alcohol dehydrogenase family)
MRQPFRLDGKRALVSGGASGIGEAICRVFSSAGASVIVGDITNSSSERLARELPNATAATVDVTDEASVRALAESIHNLDILVNNAGVGLVGGVEDTETCDFERLMRVNVEGVFLLTKYMLPKLVAARGAVINMGSVAGLIGVKKRFAYCATKGAVVAMTRQLAVDYPKELRVNCICPGTVDTPFVEGYLEKYHKHEKAMVREQLNQRQPIGRLGNPEEVAHLALYLASDEASFTTGSVITIDGGWTAA